MQQQSSFAGKFSRLPVVFGDSSQPISCVTFVSNEDSNVPLSSCGRIEMVAKSNGMAECRAAGFPFFISSVIRGATLDAEKYPVPVISGVFVPSLGSRPNDNGNNRTINAVRRFRSLMVVCPHVLMQVDHNVTRLANSRACENADRPMCE